MMSSSVSPSRVVRLPATLLNLANLCALLQRLEHSSAAPDPAQYQQLVQRVQAELLARASEAALPDLLRCFPVARELYENLNYAVAGLCQTALDTSVQSEQQARHLIDSLRRGQAGLRS